MRAEFKISGCLYGFGKITGLKLIYGACLTSVKIIKLLFKKVKQLFKKVKQICLRKLNSCLRKLNFCLIFFTEVKQTGFQNF